MSQTFIKRTVALLVSILLCASLVPFSSFANTSDAFLYGDVNGDGYITSADALDVLQVAVEKLTFNDQQIKSGDVDGSGTITSIDALYVLQRSVNKIDKFPIEIVLEEADKAAAQEVDSKIVAIGVVELNSEAVITEARTAYDSLTDAQKKLVTMLDTLISAEETLERLKIESTVFDVYVTNVTYGAKGDGATNDRAAIQAAIDAAHNAGGGTVRLDAGKTFVSGNLLMRSNVTLVIEEGTKLLQSGNPRDFVDPLNNFALKELTFGSYVDSSIQWDAAAFYNYPFIYAGDGTKNIKITGKGTIEMNSGNDSRGAMTMQAIGLFQVDGYELSEFTVQKYHAYCIKAVSCSNGLYKNLTIDITGGTIGGTDGINLNNCQNIRVTGCNLNTGDDGVYICSAYRDPREGLWYNNETPLPPENIEIDNNHCEVAWNDTKAFCFIMWGAEFPDQKQVEVNNIYIHDNYFETVGAWTGNWNLETKTFDSNGSTNAMKNIRFENNEIGTIQSNFYTLPISDVYGFDCMTSMKNGDFSEKDIYWVSRKGGSSGYTQDGYGYIDGLDKSDAALYQGLKLLKDARYVFQADVKTSEQPVRLFVKDQTTGELIDFEECMSTDWGTVTFQFRVPKDGNYHVGIERGEAQSGFAYIDNATLSSEAYVEIPEGETILTTQKPDTLNAGDGMNNMLGVAFTPKVNGKITHVRLYASAEESGKRLIGLWEEESGKLLLNNYIEWNISSGMAGWKYFELPTPVSIESGKSYVVGVTCGPAGKYSKGAGQFASAFENGNLITYDNSGRWRDVQTQAVAMPDGTTGSNYFRDVVFVADEAQPTPTPDPKPTPVIPEGETILTTQEPDVLNAGDGMNNMLGVAFTPKVNGKITHVRIYTSAEEIGSRLVGLWDAETGSLLLDNYLEWNIEAGTKGWRYYELPTAVSVEAGKTYIVGVTCGTAGKYSKGTGQFSTALENGNLITYDNSGRWRDVQTQAVAMPDGVTGSNYFRDVVFVAANE